MKHLMKYLATPLAFMAVFLVFGTPDAPGVRMVPMVGGAAYADGDNDWCYGGQSALSGDHSATEAYKQSVGNCGTPADESETYEDRGNWQDFLCAMSIVGTTWVVHHGYVAWLLGVQTGGAVWTVGAVSFAGTLVFCWLTGVPTC